VQATYPALINTLHEEWQIYQHKGRGLRERRKLLKLIITNRTVPNEKSAEAQGMSKEQAIEEFVPVLIPFHEL